MHSVLARFIQYGLDGCGVVGEDNGAARVDPQPRATSNVKPRLGALQLVTVVSMPACVVSTQFDGAAAAANPASDQKAARSPLRFFTI